MALLKILRYPDPRLRIVAAPVAAIDDRIRRLAADMIETMYEAKGVGLSATQVDVHERLIVMDTSPAHDTPRVLVNPELVAVSEEFELRDEGCLSLPRVVEKMRRPARVTVRSLDLDGRVREEAVDGLTAVCVQHEMDHLDGKVFVELLSPLRRSRIQSRMQKLARSNTAAA